MSEILGRHVIGGSVRYQSALHAQLFGLPLAALAGLFICAMASAQPATSSRISFLCGNVVTDLWLHLDDNPSPRYGLDSMIRLEMKGADGSSALAFRAGADRAGAICMTDSQQRRRIVMRADCGSSDCESEPTWLVIDAGSRQLLLEPEPGNASGARALLGDELPDVGKTIRAGPAPEMDE